MHSDVSRGVLSSELLGAGFGSSWCAMQAVLTAKFEPGTPYAAALVKTEEAFLLEAGRIFAIERIALPSSEWLGQDDLMV